MPVASDFSPPTSPGGNRTLRRSMSGTRWPAPFRPGGAYGSIWAAASVSALGDGACLSALPLLAASLSHDPRTIAGISFALTLPWAGAGLFAGLLVDRLDRARIMAITDAARAVLAGVIAALVLSRSVEIWALYALAIAMGLAKTLFDNASQTLLPEIVAPDLLKSANAWLSLPQLLGALFVGPLLGGILFAVDRSLPFYVDGATFVISALFIVRAGRQFEHPKRQQSRRSSLAQEFLSGLRWLVRDRQLRTLAAVVTALNFFGNMSGATLVLFAKSELHMSDVGFGLLLGSQAAGGILATIIVPRFVHESLSKSWITFSVILSGVAELSIAFARPAPLAALLLGTMTFGGFAWNTITISYRQQTVPNAILGRVNSIYRTAAWGAFPLGSLAGGILASAYGLRATWLVGGLGILASAALLLPALEEKPSSLKTAD